jgi:hypothetical protein
MLTPGNRLLRRKSRARSSMLVMPGAASPAAGTGFVIGLSNCIYWVGGK